MGAHSFGGAKTANSGYNGKWTGSQNNGLSEVYFSNMISSDITWKNTVNFDFREKFILNLLMNPCPKFIIA